MTQAAVEVRHSSDTHKTNPFEASLTVNQLESAVLQMCCAADALWAYVEGPGDNTLQYLVAMAQDHAYALRKIIYPDEQSN